MVPTRERFRLPRAKRVLFDSRLAPSPQLNTSLGLAEFQSKCRAGRRSRGARLAKARCVCKWPAGGEYVPAFVQAVAPTSSILPQSISVSLCHSCSRRLRCRCECRSRATPEAAAATRTLRLSGERVLPLGGAGLRVTRSAAAAEAASARSPPHIALAIPPSLPVVTTPHTAPCTPVRLYAHLSHTRTRTAAHKHASMHAHALSCPHE